MQQRPIKFRAWDIQQRRWLGCNLLMEMVTGALLWCFGDDVKYEGDPDTARIVLQQYTGFNDRNGREIYEGDILHDHYLARRGHEDQYVVAWQDGSFELADYPGDDTSPASLIPTDWVSTMEVIGNIFETPGLVSGEITP